MSDTLSDSSSCGAASPTTFETKTAVERRAEVHNFSAGQSVVDTQVLLRLQAQFTNYNDTGMSILEMSQRDADGDVQRVVREAEQAVRDLMSVPDNYSVLFMHGGAHAQFSGVPLNLLKLGDKADYVCTGYWSQRSAVEASKHINVRQVQVGVDLLADPASWGLSDDSAYVHVCLNETISGIALNEDPDVGDKVLVADMTSTLLSRPVDISKYGCIYASSGKNLGPAGICLIIVRSELLECAADHCPSILSWKTQHECRNIYNTPNVFGIWCVKEVVEDYIAKGGMQWITEQSKIKTDMIYDLVDGSNGFFTNCVPTVHRSLTAIPFHIQGGNPKMEELFIEKAAEKGIVQIFGHASVGGLRACVYNALPMASVKALHSYMMEFQEAYESQGQFGSLT